MQNLAEAQHVSQSGGLRQLLGGASVEVTTGNAKQFSDLQEFFPPGSDVHVAYLPTDHYLQTVEAAAQLRKLGYVPIPHVAARALESEAALDDFLARAAGEAGVTKALIIAGDLPRQRGPFSASLDLMKTGLLQKRGIRTIAVAGHPEGHPVMATDEMDRALAAKVAFAPENGLDLSVITQFCFDAAPIVGYVERLRSAGVDVPVRIGVAGPAGIMTLIKFGMRCGVGNSLRTLRTKGDMLGRLASDARPDEILKDVADALAREEITGIAGVHFYVFGGLRKTGQWLRDALAD